MACEIEERHWCPFPLPGHSNGMKSRSCPWKYMAMLQLHIMELYIALEERQMISEYWTASRVLQLLPSPNYPTQLFALVKILLTAEVSVNFSCFQDQWRHSSQDRKTLWRADDCSVYCMYIGPDLSFKMSEVSTTLYLDFRALVLEAGSPISTMFWWRCCCSAEL